MNIDFSPAELMRVRTTLKESIEVQKNAPLSDPRICNHRLALQKVREDTALLEKIEGYLSRGNYLPRKQ